MLAYTEQKGIIVFKPRHVIEVFLFPLSYTTFFPLSFCTAEIVRRSTCVGLALNCIEADKCRKLPSSTPVKTGKTARASVSEQVRV